MKIWQIIRFEYLEQVRRKGFWFGVLSIPILIVLGIGISIAAVFLSMGSDTIAYVDHAGVLTDPIYPPETTPFNQDSEYFIYDDTRAAQQALLDGKVDGVFVIPDDYLDTRNIILYSEDFSNDGAIDQFRDFLRYNLIHQYEADIAERIWAGSDFVIRSLDETQELIPKEWWNLALPIFSSVLLFILIQSGGSYILQAMIKEKENRMMEILVTTATPTQIMIGKTIGNLAVALTMLAVWGLCGGFVLLLGPAVILTQVTINWGIQIVSLVLFLEALMMMAGLMLMAGLITTDAREAGQLSTVFVLPTIVPFFFLAQIFFDPNGGLSKFLSIFPFTSFLAMPVRMTFSQVAGWEIALAIVALFLMDLFSVWLASRAMRGGLLNYTKRLKLTDLFRHRSSTL